MDAQKAAELAGRAGAAATTVEALRLDAARHTGGPKTEAARLLAEAVEKLRAARVALLKQAR